MNDLYVIAVEYGPDEHSTRFAIGPFDSYRAAADAWYGNWPHLQYGDIVKLKAPDAVGE